MAVDERKRLGAWYTPTPLVELVVDALVDPSWLSGRGPTVRVVDPACGDGRFLRRAVDRLRDLGVPIIEAVGVDIDDRAVTAARVVCPDATILHGDALGSVWATVAGLDGSSDAAFDLVVGNPPFLSQLAAGTARGGASRHGGGPYADAAAEFLALGSRLADPAGGRLGFVLPQSLLSARDAGDVRRSIDDRGTMIWSSWTGELDFDAQVVTCALGFEFGSPSSSGGSTGGSWASVVTDRLGVPPVPGALLRGSAVLGDRSWLNANFRDEYYGMIPAVADHADGPRLITSGLIDPGRCRWGERDVRFAKQTFTAPRIDLDALDVRMRSWATKRLRPKVLVANQTRVLEAVADVDGAWLPGVPVVAIYPDTRHGDHRRRVLEIEAVLTSASASAWAWHERGGTGLSATTIRVGPVMLAELPMPTGSLDAAVSALAAGDVVGCGGAVDEAYGVERDERDALAEWWEPLVARRTGA